MIRIINKHCVFITSTGRTGTQFLAKNLSEMIDGTKVLHEPGTPWITRPEEWPELIKKYGLYHMTLGQLRSDMSMFKLSTERLRNEINEAEAKRNLLNMRKDLINNIDKEIYIESSGHIYGAVDLLDEIIDESKFIFIIRDPRDWVKSAMNTFEYILYGPLDLDILNISIKAENINEDEFKNQWSNMSKFEKYCWYYDKVNSFVLEKMKGKSNFRIYKHGELFNNKEVFFDMLKFASQFEDGFKTTFSFREKLMKKVHSNADKKSFAGWKKWDSNMIEIFSTHCGEWMDKFDFGEEKSLGEKIQSKL